MLGVTALALFVQAAQFTVRQTQQSLDRDAGFDAAIAQGFEQGTQHPPQLEHRLLRGDMLELPHHHGHELEVLFDALAAYPAQQTQLIARAQTPCPMRSAQTVITAVVGGDHGLTVGLEIEQQQRAFGQQGIAAHGAQVVEQRQQHQRQVAAASQYALEIAGHLRQGAHQRIERLGLVAYAGACGLQITDHLTHLFGQQRCTVDFEHAQHALDLLQLQPRGLQLRGIGLRRMSFQCDAGFGQARSDFTHHQIERLACDFGRRFGLRQLSHGRVPADAGSVRSAPDRVSPAADRVPWTATRRQGAAGGSPRPNCAGRWTARPFWR